MADEPTVHQGRVRKRTVFRALVYLISLLGCSWQLTYICQDYFGYPTTTSFTISDSLPTITPPTVTLSFPYKAKIGTSLKDLFRLRLLARECLESTNAKQKTQNTCNANGEVVAPPSFFSH